MSMRDSFHGHAGFFSWACGILFISMRGQGAWAFLCNLIGIRPNPGGAKASAVPCVWPIWPAALFDLGGPCPRFCRGLSPFFALRRRQKWRCPWPQVMPPAWLPMSLPHPPAGAAWPPCDTWQKEGIVRAKKNDTQTTKNEESCAATKFLGLIKRYFCRRLRRRLVLSLHKSTQGTLVRRSVKFQPGSIYIPKVARSGSGHAK